MILNNTSINLTSKSSIYVYYFYILFLVAFISNLNAQNTTDYSQVGTWGDQGNGNYRNPILNADYPDVDIERLGDDYYMISSNVHYSPSMILLESKDLVNWEITGHVFKDLSYHPKYNWDKMEGYGLGTWAGDLAYHNGQWYCYMIDWELGFYVTTTTDIRGEWSEPVKMRDSYHWDDPCVYWDEEKQQAYYLCNMGKQHGNEEKKGQNALRLFKMSWDGMSLLDDGVIIHYGRGDEAPKIYKRNDYYYIFFVQWIDGDRKQKVLRSKSLYGPFEEKIVMEKARFELRSSSQGALVQAQDGSWWLSHQKVQQREGAYLGKQEGKTTHHSYEGRSQCLVPVEWENDWPVVGKDIDGVGNNNSVLEARMPVKGHSTKAPQTSDEFSSETLQPQWEWNHNPRNERWSLEDKSDFLRLYSSQPLDSDNLFWTSPNTISQRLMGKGYSEIIAKVDISNMAAGDIGGLSRHSGKYHLIGIKCDSKGKKNIVFKSDDDEMVGVEIKQDVIYFKTINNADVAHFYYSLDNKSWMPFGRWFYLTFGNWRGDRIGFSIWNNFSDDKNGYIDIDWFHYDKYDGPRSF